MCDNHSEVSTLTIFNKEYDKFEEDSGMVLLNRDVETFDNVVTMFENIHHASHMFDVFQQIRETYQIHEAHQIHQTPLSHASCVPQITVLSLMIPMSDSSNSSLKMSMSPLTPFTPLTPLTPLTPATTNPCIIQGVSSVKSVLTQQPTLMSYISSDN